MVLFIPSRVELHFVDFSLKGAISKPLCKEPSLQRTLSERNILDKESSQEGTLSERNILCKGPFCEELLLKGILSARNPLCEGARKRL